MSLRCSVQLVALSTADPAAFGKAAGGLGITAAALQHGAAPGNGFTVPATANGGLPSPNAALRASMRAAGLRASVGNGWAEAAPVHGMIPTDAAEPAVSPGSQLDASQLSRKKRRASASGSEVESEPASSSDSASDSYEDDFAPSSKRAKRGTTASSQRRTRAGSRAAAGGTNSVAASDKVREGQISKQKAGRRVAAGLDSDKDEPAQALPSKGGRRKSAVAEPEAKHNRENGAGNAMLPPPPPPPLPMKQVVTAAGGAAREGRRLGGARFYNPCPLQRLLCQPIQPVTIVVQPLPRMMH